MQILFIILAILAMGAIGFALYLYQNRRFLIITHYNLDGTIRQSPPRETIPDKGLAKSFWIRMLHHAMTRDATEIEFLPADDRVIIRLLVQGEWQTFDLFVNEQQFYVQLIENGLLTQCDGVWHLAPDYYKLVIRQLINMARHEIRDETLPLTFQMHVGFSNDRYFDLSVVIDQSDHGEHVHIVIAKCETDTPGNTHA